jgi:hypothetical protein
MGLCILATSDLRDFWARGGFLLVLARDNWGLTVYSSFSYTHALFLSFSVSQGNLEGSHVHHFRLADLVQPLFRRS